MYNMSSLLVPDLPMVSACDLLLLRYKVHHAAPDGTAVHAGHTDSVEAVALSAVLPVSATASIDGKLLIWDNASLSVRGTCEHPEVRASYTSYPSVLSAASATCSKCSCSCQVCTLPSDMLLDVQLVLRDLRCPHVM